ENSQFIKNSARWGTITNDHVITINNCTLRDGISYDLSSTFKYGSGVASNTGSADYFNRYRIYGIITNIDNCLFENNGQTDVYQAEGNLTLTNSEFNNATGVYLTDNVFGWNYNTDDFAFTIENNTFTDVKISSLFTTLSSYSDKVFAVYSNTTYLATIKDNKITLNNDGFGIYLTSNNTVENNTLDSKIQVDGNYNTITQNTITNNEKAAIYLSTSANNNVITDNTLQAMITTGNSAVDSNKQTNTIENNVPESPVDVELSDETYSQFFNEDGTLKTSVVNGTMIKIVGDVNNKNITLDNAKVGIKRENGKLNNVSITVKENANTIIDSVIINNTNSNPYAVQLESENNIILSSTININTTNPVTAVVIKGDSNKLESNTMKIYGPSSNTTGLADTIAVDIQSSNNRLTGNSYQMYNTTDSTANIIGIKIQNNDHKLTNNYVNGGNGISITNNNIIGFYLENADNNTIEGELGDNFIPTNEGIGVYLVDSENNIITECPQIRNTNAKSICGIKVEGKTKIVNYNIIKTPSITTLGENAVCLELINTNNTNIQPVTEKGWYRATGNDITTISIVNSNNTNISYFTAQIFDTSNNSSSMFKVINSDNTRINGISFEKSVGSYAQIINSTNTFIGQGTSTKNVTIISKDVPITIKNSSNTNITGITAIIDNSVAIELTDSDNNSITNNYLKAQHNGGDLAVNQINSNNNELINNTPETIKITDDNYDEYFTDNVFNKENTLIVIDSNINDKILTFTNPNSLIYNPNNYTITGGKIEFTPESMGTNITNLNTKDTPIIIGASNLRLENSTITSDSDKLEITINNTRGVIINNNTITAENMEGSAINVIDSQATITNNYIVTKNAEANVAINSINSQLTLNKNTPTPKLTDDTYNQYFDENGVYNASELINLIELGSDLYDKNMTFNTEITLENPDKFTVYNATITNTANKLTVSSLIINNTDYPYPTIISSNIIFNNNTVYQSGNNLKVIISENSTNTSQFRYNDFICEGNNNILISCNNITTAFEYNNVNLTGDEIVFINTINSKVNVQYNNLSIIRGTGETPVIYYSNITSITYVRYNNITINNSQTTTPIIIDNARVRFDQNKLLVNTTQNDMPIIKVIKTTNGRVNNNYIESLDLFGNDAIETPGPKTGNTPTGNKDIESIISIEPITVNIGEATDITVSVSSTNNMPINEGKVYFKINGKVLRDSNNKVIYADVSNGIANVTVNNTINWNENTEIKSYFVNSKIYTDSVSEVVNPTVTVPEEDEPLFSVEDVTTTAGSEVTISVTTKNLDDGKVVLKVNGKTVKNSDGKL
ncbi:MAG: hypothetical protein BZ136_08160, partial [Methanosphaera sp. rholeuAM74]